MHLEFICNGHNGAEIDRDRQQTGSRRGGSGGRIEYTLLDGQSYNSYMVPVESNKIRSFVSRLYLESIWMPKRLCNQDGSIVEKSIAYAVTVAQRSQRWESVRYPRLHIVREQGTA